jgi:hypothetical protein
MKSFTSKVTHIAILSAILIVAFYLLTTTPRAAAVSPDTASISVTNESGRGIRFVYSTAVSSDAWSDNLLPSESILQNGQTATLNNVTCSGSEVRLIAEDMDGCFLSTVVACANGSSWNIDSDTLPQCGGN